MLERAFDYLLKEWSVIKQAPLAFIVCVLLGACLGWFLGKSFYAERIEVISQRIEDFQERLGLVPKDRTAYSKMTNRELRAATLELVARLREFEQTVEVDDRDSYLAQFNDMRNAKTEEERTNIWQHQNQALSQRSFQRQFEFGQNYRADALLLRDEMLRRLPKQPKEQRPIVALDRGMLGGIRPVGEAADYLERLAKLLP